MKYFKYLKLQKLRLLGTTLNSYLYRMPARSTLYFWIILLSGLILRLFSLETNGLWLDEIWSMIASAQDQSLQEVVLNALNDTHPPLFDILLYGGLKLSGGAEFTGRYLALIFGLAGVVLSFYYGKKIAQDQRIALLLMAVCSFNFFHIYYSMEGRFYSLIFLLSLICIAELYLIFQNEEKKSLHIWRYIGAGILLCYTHYYGGILLAAMSFAIFLNWIVKEIDNKQFLQFIGMQVIVLMAFSPCIPYMFGKSSLDSWMSVPSIGDFFNYYYLYSGKNPLEFAWLFLPLLFFFKVGKNKGLKVLLYTTILLSFLLPFIVSHISLPMLHKRYTVIYLPSIFIMSAMAWPQLKRVEWKWSTRIYAIIAISVVLNILFLRKEFKPGAKDQWKEVAIYLKEQNAEQIVASQAYYLNYYLDRMEVPLAVNELQYDSEFWLLTTNIDEENFLDQKDFEIIETIDYPQKFQLYKLRAN